MSLRVFNTLGRKLEEFKPLQPPRVGMYVCGPTVYGHSHLGHAKSYVAFDAIVRWLRYSGYDVNYVQNITDVGHLTDDADEGEDKVVAEARRRGLHPMAVVETFMRSYLDDMDALSLVRPDIMPRATGHIPEQIAQIEALVARGHAYECDGSVYFDVSSFADYGKLSGRKTDELEAGARVAVSSEKRNPADFALWKRCDSGHIMKWPSPWGDGFPGWHIECSAMSQKYLGETFDIHGGGLENQFPHHECEIAQAEGATGQPFARYWLHNNMCTINGQKMGKSLGNSVFLKDIFHTAGPLHSKPRNADEAPQLLLERAFEPVVVKHFILTSHYRQTLDFSNDALKAAESGCYKLRDSLASLRAAAGIGGSEFGVQGSTTVAFQRESEAPAEPAAKQLKPHPDGPTKEKCDVLSAFHDRFSDAMDDDFNTAAAIAALFDVTKQTNQWIADGTKKTDLVVASNLLEDIAGNVLGLHWPTTASGSGKSDDVIQILADLRNQARKDKNFALSDQIRDRLAAIDIELRDTPEGTKW